MGADFSQVLGGSASFAGFGSGGLSLVAALVGLVIYALLQVDTGNDDDDSSPGGGLMQPLS